MCQYVNKNVSTDEIASGFVEIARELFLNYAIVKGADIYRFTILEFYYYSKGHHEDTTTYPRTSPAGSFFFHQSGFDLSFESNFDEGYYGGILIRGIEPIAIAEKSTIKTLSNKNKDYLKDRPQNIRDWLFEFESQNYLNKEIQVMSYKNISGLTEPIVNQVSGARRNIKEGQFEKCKYRFKSNNEFVSTKTSLENLI
jgi:hypothetical protein